MSFQQREYPKSTFDNWDFRNHHVGFDQGGANTNAITPENFFIAAGPARLQQVGEDFSNKVFPLGMTEQASVNQQKAVQPIREIGSRRSYHISSYSTGQISLSRVMYSQASLLRVLTVANDDYDDLDSPAGAKSHRPFSGDVGGDTRDPSFYINLQSTIFDRPIGLLFYILDQRNQPYGAMYAEDVMIQTHGFGLSAQGISISEQVSLVFDRMVPVAVRGA